MNVLYWNIAGRDCYDVLVRAIREFDLDLLALAEAPKGGDLLAQEIRSRGVTPYSALPASDRGIEVLYEPTRNRLTGLHDGARFRIAAVDHDSFDELIFAFVHLSSKLFSNGTAEWEARKLSSTVQTVESERGHDSCVVVGDFNMSPFEPGMVEADALHSTMSMPLAKRGFRKFQRERVPLMYNPMWQLYGKNPLAPATYFWSSGGNRELFWHMFDQVLVRGTLVDRLRGLQILTHIGNIALVGSSGRPNRAKASDHLPILFEISS